MIKKNNNINLQNLFLVILLYTSPFINLSIIPNSNLPITYFVALIYFLILIVFKGELDFKKITFSIIDFSYFLFLFSILLTIILNSFSVSNISNYTQFFNLILSYIIFKATQTSRLLITISSDYVLTKWFRFNSIVCFISIIIYIIGLYNEPFVRTIFNIFNNSGNFSQGGLITQFTEEKSARLNSFSPEPSFWGFFTSFNLALGLSLKKRNYILIFITLLCLVLTLSRTAYLMFVFYLIYILWNSNTIVKLCLFFIAVFSVLFFLNNYGVDFLLEFDDSFRQRFGSLIVGGNIFLQNPFLGIGIGNFAQFAKLQGLDFSDIFSLYFNFLVAGGIISFSLFLFFCLKSLQLLEFKHKPIWIIILAGWLTVSSYNLPFVWVFLGIASIYDKE